MRVDLGDVVELIRLSERVLVLEVEDSCDFVEPLIWAFAPLGKVRFWVTHGEIKRVVPDDELFRV